MNEFVDVFYEYIWEPNIFTESVQTEFVHISIY